MTPRIEQNNRAIYFRSLHRPGDPLVLTNVYDAATASIIAGHPSTKAIATASFAIAASQGIDDNALTLSENLAIVRPIAALLDRTGVPPSSSAAASPSTFPLTVDVQDGYEDPAQTVKELIQLGAVGCNLEDMHNATGQLRPLPEAVERVKRALAAAREAGIPDFVVNARTDALLTGRSLDDAIARGKAYLDAGATTVFVWGGAKRGVSRDEIVQLVEAFEGRLNVKFVPREGFLTLPELKALGVARVSMGPELWRAAVAAFQDKAHAILKTLDA